jgi:hypothetical protein
VGIGSLLQIALHSCRVGSVQAHATLVLTRFLVLGSNPFKCFSLEARAFVLKA